MMKEKLLIKKCTHHGDTDFILENRNAYRCKKCRSESIAKKRKIIKERLIDIFGGKCIICEYNKCDAALEFHHLDPEKKSFDLSKRNYYRSFDKILEEAKKCILVCANCHREIENNLVQIPLYHNGNGTSC